MTKVDIVYNKDARSMLDYVQQEEVTCTITSPPYFDMKDYGGNNQIGFGQTYDIYLKDIQTVFKHVYDVTKINGTLWIVIDTFKKKGQVIPLPFDIANQLKQIGWLLQDIIIWKKDKTVPWSGNGFAQRKFEYILLFSKSSVFKYNKDRVRVYDTSHLKKWWVQYPERYNPKGKAIDEVWEYSIPIQGSWGDKYIKHFCPLPKDMVGNMIQLSTDENDIVMDPFSGSGAVLSQASYMKRHYIGFELNKPYIEMFTAYLNKTNERGQKNYESVSKNDDQESFETMIINLRSLKYAKLLGKKLNDETILDKYLIFVFPGGKSSNRHKLVIVKYYFYGNDLPQSLIDLSKNITSKPPLSKFGIEPEISITSVLPKEVSIYRNLYGYTQTNTHHIYTRIDVNDIDQKVKIISPIRVELNEKDFE